MSHHDAYEEPPGWIEQSVAGMNFGASRLVAAFDFVGDGMGDPQASCRISTRLQAPGASKMIEHASRKARMPWAGLLCSGAPDLALAQMGLADSGIPGHAVHCARSWLSERLRFARWQLDALVRTRRLGSFKSKIAYGPLDGRG